MAGVMTDSIPITGFNRVELIVREEEIDDAVRQFNEVLGLHIVPPHRIAGAPVLSATDFDGSIEFVAPVGGKGHFGDRLARGGPGQIGPLVWEVADIDQAREWLRHNGYQIIYEYNSSQGNESEQATPRLSARTRSGPVVRFQCDSDAARVTRRQCCVPTRARPPQVRQRRPERKILRMAAAQFAKLR